MDEDPAPDPPAPQASLIDERVDAARRYAEQFRGLGGREPVDGDCINHTSIRIVQATPSCQADTSCQADITSLSSVQGHA
jgi:hypothetical protein